MPWAAAGRGPSMAKEGRKDACWRRTLRKRLTDIMIERGLVDELQVASAVSEQRQWGGKLGEILVKKGFLPREGLINCLAIYQGIERVSLKDLAVSPSALRCLSAGDAKRYGALPLSVEKKVLTVAMEDPTDLAAIDAMALLTGKRIRPLFAGGGDVRALIAEHYDNLERKSYIEEGGFTVSARAPRRKSSIHAERPQPPSGKSSASEPTLDALVRLLISKGLITEIELEQAMKEKR